MSTAIGASTLSFSVGNHPSRAALDAEVAQYKKQLADCVNCPATSSSPEGKAVIQDLSSKISADQGRIRQIESTEALAKSPSTLAVQPANETKAYTAAGAATTFTDAAKGNLLNEFA